MAALITLTTAAGTVKVDPDWVCGIANDGGANTTVDMVGGTTYTVTDAYSDVEAAVNEGKLFGRTRVNEVRVMNARTS